jgi:hypothetical protein
LRSDSQFLRSSYEAIAQLFRSYCAAIAKQLRSDCARNHCAAIAQQFHSYFAALSKLSRSDRKWNCTALSWQLRSDGAVVQQCTRCNVVQCELLSFNTDATTHGHAAMQCNAMKGSAMQHKSRRCLS